MLILQNIHKQYGQLPVLRGVNMSVKSGETVAIVGSSGAGKSTLLHIAGSLDRPNSGKVLLNGTDITSLSVKKLAAFRNQHMGFVFQFHHLLPEFTALENICIPGWIAGQKRRFTEQNALSLLEKMGLSSRAQHKPAQLSGGEQQRVAIARALINKPDIVFADEPTGNLDSTNAQSLNQLFVQLSQETGQTFLIVTHNQDLAALCNRIIYMKDGLIVEH
jgi:lipoprotein-releasing system ATP-binding protein